MKNEHLYRKGLFLNYQLNIQQIKQHKEKVSKN